MCESVGAPRFDVVADPRPGDTAWPAMSWPPEAEVLAGTVVELSPLDPARDAAELFAALDHDTVWEHLAARPRDADDYTRALTQLAEKGGFAWLVRLRQPHAGLSAGTVVGTSSYLDVSVHDARLEIGATAYTPAVWGNRVNAEVKLMLLAQAFEVLLVGRVQLKTDVRNVRSQLAVARLGARYEGTLRRYQRRTDRTVRDTALFSVLAEEWPSVRSGLRARLRDQT